MEKRMLSKIRGLILNHIKNNTNRYLLLLAAFVIGVSAGAFTVNGLSATQREELGYYIQGFLQLLNKQSVDSGELFRIALMENVKIIGALWILGVMIIGVPFIFILVGIRGFITGFSSGFLIMTLGMKGIVFFLISLMPKELLVIPSIIALGVNGMNFSMNIIRNRSSRHFVKESLKSSFLSYCFVTLFYSVFILAAVLIETYIVPVFIRMAAPMFM
jgi:stage II sporulation protein M